MEDQMRISREREATERLRELEQVSDANQRTVWREERVARGRLAQLEEPPAAARVFPRCAWG